MPIEDLFGIATWGQIVFDPVRPRIYFSESRPDKQTNRMHSRIMMMSTEQDSGTPVALTAGPTDHLPIPSPAGEWLTFLSKRSGSQQVWRLPLFGGEPIQVTFIEGGVKSYAWVPDGSGLVVVAHIKNGELQSEKAGGQPGVDASDAMLFDHFNRDVRTITHHYYKLDGEGFFDDGRNQLVFVPLEDEPELLTNGLDNYSLPVFSPDGKELYCLYHAYDPEKAHPGITEVRCMSWPSGEWRTLDLPAWSIEGLQVSADGQQLAFMASKPDDLGYGPTSLYRFDLKAGTLTDLSGHLDRSVGDQSGSDIPAPSTAKPVWKNDNLLMLLSDQGSVSLAEFSLHGVERLWNQKRVVYDFAVHGNQVALAFSDPVNPSAISLTEFGSNAQSLTFAPVPWDDEHAPVAPQELWATESDGTLVHTWCLRPPGPGPHPTILEIHGGPMSMYGYRYFHEFQCLVQAGYAVVYTNPRGSQGYGHRFCDAIIGQWGDKDYRDVMAGLDAALATWSDLDEARMGTAGGSYGGFMVNWIVSHSDRFQAAITMRSVVNRFSAMGSSDMGWLRIPQYGSKPWWEEPEPYWQQSPLKYASNIRTPLLIEHQEKDFRLPIEQGEQLYNALKYLGRTVEMVIYPNESHGMSRGGQPWHRIHRLHHITHWFDKYLKD